MAKKHISEADRTLFRERAGDVKPLINDSVEHRRPRPAPRPAPPTAQEHDAPDAGMPDGAMDVEPEEHIEFYRPGLQHRLIQRLRRGQLRLEAELDLHGMTVAQAGEALARFITECREQGWRTVRVIHGKGFGSRQGRGVLKHHVGRWLKLREDVVACCPAKPADGGTGAVYVLLKR